MGQMRLFLEGAQWQGGWCHARSAALAPLRGPDPSACRHAGMFHSRTSRAPGPFRSRASVHIRPLACVCVVCVLCVCVCVCSQGLCKCEIRTSHLLVPEEEEEISGPAFSSPPSGALQAGRYAWGECGAWRKGAGIGADWHLLGAEGHADVQGSRCGCCAIFGALAMAFESRELRAVRATSGCFAQSWVITQDTDPFTALRAKARGQPPRIREPAQCITQYIGT